MSREADHRGVRLVAALAVAAALTAPASATARAGQTLLEQQSWGWWGLLAALAALGVVLLLLRRVGYQRLSRLWQSVVASILIHVALTAAMSLVAVSLPVVALVTGLAPREASVSLVAGQEAQLRAQVRYQLTELPVADPSLAALMRAGLEEVRAPAFEPTELGAPLSEPQRAELDPRPEPPWARPPVVDDRVPRPPPESGRPSPARVEVPRRPVATPEPRIRAEAEPPAPVPSRRRQQADAPWQAAELDAPPTPPNPRSIVVPTSRVLSSLPEPGREPVVARAAVDEPALELWQPAAPIRLSDRAPPGSDVRPAGALSRRATGELTDRSRPESLASPERLPPADPRGASLTAHLSADLHPPVARDVPLDRVLPRPAIVPLGVLIPQRMKVVKPLDHRTPAARKKLVEEMGGSKISEASVQRALAYLARSQEPDGRWRYIHEANTRRQKRPPNRDDVGLTGLAVLCFLAADYRPDKPSRYREHVAGGLAYLLAAQEADGDLRGGGDMYSHGIATLALGEAAAMTRDPLYGQAAIQGARFVAAAQNRVTGGWRYAPGEGGDTSVLGWQVMALYSVSRLGVAIPAGTRRGALRWLARVGRGRHGMLAGYQKANPTRTMTAEALFSRLLLGQHLGRAQRKEAAGYLRPPDPVELANFYGWYYGSLALFQLRDASWGRWNQAVRDRLTASQQRGGELDGSWDPSQSRWGGERGGRVYTTALATLTLEVYYRYLPMFGGKAGPGP